MEAITLGLIAALAWGIHDILVRSVSRSLGILQSLLAVLFFGLLAQTAVVFASSEFANINMQAIWMSVLAGLIFFVACIGHYNAFSRGPVRIVAPIIGCYSVLAFLIAAATGVAINSTQWLAVLALVIGIALIAQPSGSADETADDYSLPKTLGYCALAMLGFAGTFAVGQEASATADPGIMGLITRFTTTILAGIAYFIWLQKSPIAPSWPNGKNTLILISMGILDAIALGVVLAAGAVPRPEFASAASSIFGLVTILLAWMFIKEKIGPIQWIGILGIFASIAYLSSSA